MISETGKNLVVLIITETDKDWQTFATWYSVYKNLPDAKPYILCERNGILPFVSMQWSKRLQLPMLRFNPFGQPTPLLNWLYTLDLGVRMVENPKHILALNTSVMATDAIHPEDLSYMNEKDLWVSEDAWYIKNPKTAELINTHFLEDRQFPMDERPLTVSAKEEKLGWFVNLNKGCGRWINTAKGCPFSSAGGLSLPDMTANEHRVIELWKKMVPLYNALY